MAEYKDLVVDETDGKARYNLVDRSGNILASGVTLELASTVVQAGSDWGALEANLLLAKDGSGVPAPRTDNPHKVTAGQTGAYTQAQTDAKDKAAADALAAHKGEKGNPHGTTAAQVGAYTKAETDSRLSGKADSTGTYPGLNVGRAAASDSAKTLTALLPPSQGGTGRQFNSLGFTSWVGTPDANGRFVLSGLSDALLVAVGSVGNTAIGNSKHCVSFASPDEAGPGRVIGNVFEASTGMPVTGYSVRVSLIYFDS